MKINVNKYIAKAFSLARKGDLDGARRIYNVVLQSYPNNLRAWEGLAGLDKPTPEKNANPPQQQLDALIGLYNKGLLSEAVDEAHSMVVDFPSSFVVWNILGTAYKAIDQVQKAESAFRHASAVNPNFPNAHNNLGVVLSDQGKLDEALFAYERALALKPDYAAAYYNMGNALKDQGKLDEAIAAYERALALKPDYAVALNNLGVTLKEQGKLDEAIVAYERALSLKPDHADAFYNLGVTLNDQGKLDKAIIAYERALALKPDYASACYNMGNALKDQGKLDEAIAAYERALALKPDYAAAHNNMGVTLKEQGKLDEAIAAYERALSFKPDHADAFYNLGVTLNDQGKLDEAIIAYERALVLKPGYAVAYNNMGVTLNEQGKPDEAIAAYERALKLKPDHADAYNNMGVTLQEQGRHNEAIAAFERALALEPGYASTEAQMLHQKNHICDFSVASILSEASERLGIFTDLVPPFGALPWMDDPRQQLQRSQKWANEKYKQSPLPLPARPKIRPQRLKIGYFSADFHDHATMYLMAGLLHHHNAEQFEVFAYSYGRSKSGNWRKKTEGSVDHFFDVADQSDSKISHLARDHGLDIAIDLKGYTTHTRSGTFQYRLAPIQINYLGYPGSMGADFIDYIIADPVVIPTDQRQFYSEKVIYLPHSYQPNDNTREIALTLTTRADFCLPEGAFVFCCFNNNYKINQRNFDIWMRLLGKVKGSVLWLIKSNPWAEQNLRKEAELRGVDPARIVFAKTLSHSEHLARHKHADLFLDTFNVNAHTTASDALWGGLPVVTKQGKQFAAQVAASLLSAVGLPELVAETDEHYEAMILALANDPKKLASIRRKLEENRLTEPLFDTKRYAFNFERGLNQAYDLYFQEKQHQDIWVTEI